MREIKFRVWDTEKKQFFNPTYNASEGQLEELFLQPHGGICMRTIQGFTHESVFPNRFVLQQYTGLKDKNGKEIWEGDVVIAAMMHHGKPGTPFMAFILYNEHIGSFRIGYDSLGGGSQDEIYFRYQIEVIGNIYENPDLLQSPNSQSKLLNN